jgi:hypothetical protein
VLQQQLSQLVSFVLPSSIMRPKRTRQATKQQQDDEYVDLDSDEFEQALAEDEPAAARPRKRQKDSRDSSAALQARAQQQQQQEVSDAAAGAADDKPAAAAAVVDLLQESDASDCSYEQKEETEEEDSELEEFIECSDDPVLQDSAAAGYKSNDSDSDSSESEYEDSEDAEAAAAAAAKERGKQQKGKQQQKQKKPRKKRPSTRRLCASFAKAQYRLTDADLKQLTDVVYEPNPHYPGGVFEVLFCMSIVSCSSMPHAVNALRPQPLQDD